jgi:hypothetical protein
MLRTMLLAASLLLLGFSSTWAQCNPGTDEICIVFDYPACCENCTYVPPGSTVDLYFVLQNPSAAGGVLGYEFDLCQLEGPNILNLGFTFPIDIIPIVPPPPFVISLPEPLPAEPCVLLAVQHMIVLGPDCWCNGVIPVTGGSVPGEMVYVDGGNPGNLIVMNPCTGPGGDSCTMACINCADCLPVGEGAETWGGLKVLYR